jgi:hypothetical protein
MSKKFFKFIVYDYNETQEDYVVGYPLDLRLDLIQKIEHRNSCLVVHHSITPHSDHYAYFHTKLTNEEYSELWELLNGW